MHNDPDVVIVGGGPAGSMTAYHLAKAGVKVSIIDKTRFPRQKVCGGGVQFKCLAEIPFDISPVIQNTMIGIRFSYKLNKVRDGFTKLFVEHSDKEAKALVCGVLRSEFDNFLLEHAEKMGVKIYQNITISNIERCGESLVAVSSEGRRFKSRLLVGADGANSIVTRQLNDKKDFFTQIGICQEIPREIIRPEKLEHTVMRVDWGTLSCGYAWIFPKSDTINIGVGAPEPLAKQLRNYLENFLLVEGLIDQGDLEKIRFTGHRLPTMTSRTKVSGDGILLVGDAAGFIEPLTGDGISYALCSAHLAAEVMLYALNSHDLDISQYNKLVHEIIWPEIFHARSLMTSLNAFPHVIHRMFMKNDGPWKGFCRVLRGDDDPKTGVKYNYQYFKEKKLGFLKFIWYGIDPLTEAYVKKRIKKGDAEETVFQKFVTSVIGPLVEKI